MTNAEYRKLMVAENELIYIDTATLMNVESMTKFINNSRDEFLSRGRKIIVPLPVIQELERHLGSKEKYALAIEATNLIFSNTDIFQIEIEPTTMEEVDNAFADAHILSELTLNKSDYSQLLITNDTKLSRDAFSLNEQLSCKGHRVKVCYINWAGEMHRCECTHRDETKSVTSLPVKQTIKAVDRNITTTKSASKIDNTNKTVSRHVTAVVSVIGGVIGGVLVERYKKEIINIIRTVAVM